MSVDYIFNLLGKVSFSPSDRVSGFQFPLGAWLRPLIAKVLGDPKVGAAVRICCQGLHHSIPGIIAGASGVARRVERDPCLASIWTLEEAVVSRAEVAVGAAQEAAIALRPSTRRSRVACSVPLQQRNAVLGRPAVVRRVGDVCLPTEVETNLAFLNRDLGLFPGLVRLRDDGQVTG